jgi:hypothetical protein
MNSVYTFQGPCRWAKVYVPDEKFGPKYSIEVKLDDTGVAKYKEAGCQGLPSKDGEGYYTFRRTKTSLTRKGKVIEYGPPKVVDTDGNPFTALIGNGSVVTVKVETFPTEKGTGTRLVALRVDEHVPYEAPKRDEEF